MLFCERFQKQIIILSYSTLKGEVLETHRIVGRMKLFKDQIENSFLMSNLIKVFPWSFIKTKEWIEDFKPFFWFWIYYAILKVLKWGSENKKILIIIKRTVKHICSRIIFKRSREIDYWKRARCWLIHQQKKNCL